MTTDNNITTNFTYTCPDAPYVDTTDDNIQVSATYSGPDTWWVFIDDNNRWAGQTFSASNGGNEIVAPAGLTKVRITTTDNPTLVSLIDPAGFIMNTAQADVTETITLADDTTADHVYRYPLDPQDYIDQDTVTYDVDADTWSWSTISNELSWTEVVSQRDQKLESSDYRIADDMPDSVRTPWITYRQALRDLPTQWQGVDAWKVQFPEEPAN